MIQTSSAWLYELQPYAHLNVAQHVLTKNKYSVPINILELLEEYADVRFTDWEFDCDALVADLTTQSRPSVFVKNTPGFLARRQRFTLAHELGHVAIAWHTGTLHCTTSSSLPKAVGSTPGAQPKDPEAEANEFAGAVLMPFEDLLESAKISPLETFFRSLDRYQLSPPATVIRVSSVLRPGFTFSGRFGEDWTKISSPGTALANIADLARLAVESGSFIVDGKNIDWYRTAELIALERDVDPRATSEILSASLRSAGVGEASIREEAQKFQGIIAGALSKVRFQSEGEAYSHIKQWVLTDKRFDKLRMEPDFDIFLRRKSFARVEKLAAGKDKSDPVI